MIQRIQTVYLAIVFIASAVAFFFPIASYLSETEYLKLYLYKVENLVALSTLVYNQLFTIPLLAIVALILILSMIAVFNFKKRLLQIKLVNFAILLDIVLIVVMFFYTDRVAADVGVTTSYEVGSVFPIVALVFLVLALRGIRKDEKLIRSADRLR